MTRQDLINNLGTIAKSGTSEFLGKLAESAATQDASDLIGQVGKRKIQLPTFLVKSNPTYRFSLELDFILHFWLPTALWSRQNIMMINNMSGNLMRAPSV